MTDHITEGAKLRARSHTVHMENRSRISITGVCDVESFNEQEVLLATEAGGLRVEGDNLHLSKLNLEDGQIILEGEIAALEYESVQTERSGLFSRMFR